MILADTSIWVAHFRAGKIGLEHFLNDGEVVCHPLIIGELACGNLKNRAEIITLMQALPTAVQAEHEDVLLFIENHQLMGKGLGYIDMHLLASSLLTEVPLWTLDKKLGEIAAELGVGWSK
jgi:predicted nucleic acid-binding protein